MKDEEMADKHAEEYRKNFRYYRAWHGQIVDKSPSTIVEQSFKDGFLAGLKAGRPQWHDLRKDPKDLPKDTVSVLISRGTPRTSRARYNGKWYGYYSDDEIEDVIAWCELPIFDKE